MEKLTKHQIIDETVEYYSNNPRATQNVNGMTKCTYQNPDGLLCAHSRCLTDEGRENVLTFDPYATAYQSIDKFGDEIHQEKYRGHKYDFWAAIQGLHDYSGYWSENGLSEIGKEYVEHIKTKFKN